LLATCFGDEQLRILKIDATTSVPYNHSKIVPRQIGMSELRLRSFAGGMAAYDDL